MEQKYNKKSSLIAIKNATLNEMDIMLPVSLYVGEFLRILFCDRKCIRREVAQTRDNAEYFL